MQRDPPHLLGSHVHSRARAPAGPPQFALRTRSHAPLTKKKKKKLKVKRRKTAARGADESNAEDGIFVDAQDWELEEEFFDSQDIRPEDLEPELTNTNFKLPDDQEDIEVDAGIVRHAPQQDGHTQMPGRLRAHYSKWKAIGTSWFVLQWILFGFALPFIAHPPAYYHENHPGAFTHFDQTTKGIAELVATGVARMVPDRPYICSPLDTIPKKDSGKFRLLLDLRYLNLFLSTEKFRYESVAFAEYIFNEGDYMASLDLKNGYHHLEIQEAHHQYSGGAGVPQEIPLVAEQKFET